jgi:transmembrane sensor
MLLADNLRLADFATELARYRSGITRCDPALADLRISGAYPIADSERTLKVLAATYPIAVQKRFGDYWVTLAPR